MRRYDRSYRQVSSIEERPVGIGGRQSLRTLFLVPVTRVREGEQVGRPRIVIDLQRIQQLRRTESALRHVIVAPRGNGAVRKVRKWKDLKQRLTVRVYAASRNHVSWKPDAGVGIF